jgi:hypothetical protein
MMLERISRVGEVMDCSTFQQPVFAEIKNTSNLNSFDAPCISIVHTMISQVSILAMSSSGSGTEAYLLTIGGNYY